MARPRCRFLHLIAVSSGPNHRLRVGHHLANRRVDFLPSLHNQRSRLRSTPPSTPLNQVRLSSLRQHRRRARVPELGYHVHGHHPSLAPTAPAHTPLHGLRHCVSSSTPMVCVRRPRTALTPRNSPASCHLYCSGFVPCTPHNRPPHCNRPGIAKAFPSIPALWLEVVEARHPRATLSITVTPSKATQFQPRSASSQLQRTLPLLGRRGCSLVRLQGPTLAVVEPFLSVKEGSFPTRGLTVSVTLNPLRSLLLAPNTHPPADSAHTTPMVCVSAALLRPSWVVPPRPKRKLAGVLSPPMCQQRSRLKLW